MNQYDYDELNRDHTTVKAAEVDSFNSLSLFLAGIILGIVIILTRLTV